MNIPFNVPGFGMDFDLHGRFLKMTTLEAAQTMLQYDFGIGDELALGYASRKGPCNVLDDDTLFDLLGKSVDFNWTPQDVLDVAADESTFTEP